MKMQSWTFALLLCAVSPFGTAIGRATEFSGHVKRVLDGDDIEMCEGGKCRDIRLCGIDAPERGCPRYEEAGAALRALVEGKQVRCVQVGSGTVCDGR